MTRLAPGDRVPDRVVVDLSGTTRRIPSGSLLHLQLRRFAGCPICNLHMAEYAHRIDEIVAAGVEPLVLFNATREGMLPYQGDLPFPTAPDPDFSLYRAFGVERSMVATITGTSWVKTLRGMAGGVAVGAPERMSAGTILPADFLIDGDGVVLDCHYAANPSDGWPVDALLERLAARSG